MLTNSKRWLTNLDRRSELAVKEKENMRTMTVESDRRWSDGGRVNIGGGRLIFPLNHFVVTTEQFFYRHLIHDSSP